MFWRAVAYGSVGVALLAFARLAGNAAYEPWDIPLIVGASLPYVWLVSCLALGLWPDSGQEPHPLTAVTVGLLVAIMFCGLFFALLQTLDHNQRLFAIPVIPICFVATVFGFVAMLSPPKEKRATGNTLAHLFLILVLCYGAYGMHWSDGGAPLQ